MKFSGKFLLTLFSCLIFLFCLNTVVFAKKHHSTHHATHATKKKNEPAKAIIYGPAALVAEINRIITPGMNVGIQIKSMRHGDMLYSRNANQFFVPASILKVFTAESALLFMGSNYQFPTVFATDGQNINQGVLQGNLYLIHSGDPSLTYYDLSDLMAALKAKNIWKIAGNVYIDTSAYDQEIYGPGWISNDTRFCYGAPISASIINHNCMVVQLPVKSRHKSKNNLPQNASVVVTNIIHYNKSLIESLFQHNGIYISGSILPGVAPEKPLIIAAHQSKPLHDLISEMLKKSDNIIAGSLFKKMGELYTKQPGSWENGSRAVKQILQQKMGVNTARMNILDGSGLSRNNQIAPSQMLQVLDFAYHNGATSYDFISALPIAGVDGTLKHRMQNIRSKVRAKTGTMNGVVALAGYAITKQNEPLGFVIIINGHLGMGWKYKEVENKIMTVLTNYSR